MNKMNLFLLTTILFYFASASLAMKMRSFFMLNSLYNENVAYAKERRELLDDVSALKNLGYNIHLIHEGLPARNTQFYPSFAIENQRRQLRSLVRHADEGTAIEVSIPSAVPFMQMNALRDFSRQYSKEAVREDLARNLYL